MVYKKYLIRGLLLGMLAVTIVLVSAYAIRRGKAFLLKQYEARITAPLMEVQTSIAAAQTKLDSIVARVSALEASQLKAALADRRITPGYLFLACSMP